MAQKLGNYLQMATQHTNKPPTDQHTNQPNEQTVSQNGPKIIPKTIEKLMKIDSDFEPILASIEHIDTNV